jgi:nucleotide-binding universal stress UspA family protein
MRRYFYPEAIVRILLAVDRSEQSSRVVETVASHSWPSGTEAQVLLVVEAGAPSPEIASLSADTVEPERQSLQRTADELTTRYANWLCSSGLVASGKTLSGDPPSIILGEARAWETDLIVVGSEGESGPKQLLLGSVAHHVVTQALCSVLVVRQRTLIFSDSQQKPETTEFRRSSA